MKLKNTSGQPLRFKLRGPREVPAGGEFDCPDDLVYAVCDRGLPLEPEGGWPQDAKSRRVPAPAAASEVVAAPPAPATDTEASIWRHRAEQAKDEIYRLEAALDAQSGDVQVLRSELAKMRSEVEKHAADAKAAKKSLGEAQADLVEAKKEIAALSALADQQTKPNPQGKPTHR